MGQTCSSCGVSVSGADILYAPDGRIVCAACFGKIDLTAATRAPWRGFAIGGAIAGAGPFAIHMSTSSSTSFNGEVTSFVYRDWMAVIGGVVAVMLAAATLWVARRETLRRMVAMAAGLGVLALGAIQIARGLGVFEQPGSGGNQTSISITENTPAPAPAVDPARPDTCPDQNACFDLGRKLETSKDFANATVAYVRACEQGARGGCFNAGFLLSRRDKPAWDQAARMFQHGCDLDDSDSCSELGLAYKLGRGTALDLARAKTIFDKGCGAGHPLSCVNLADFYDSGLGIPKDPKQAFELFAKGCDLGDDQETAIGCDRAGIHLYGGDGAKADKKRAAAYFGKACARAAPYCYNFGVATEHGDGVAKDPAKARELYDKACQAGKPDACNNLGHLLDIGQGGPKDAKAAKALFKQACDGGFELGCNNLKTMKK